MYPHLHNIILSTLKISNKIWFAHIHIFVKVFLITQLFLGTTIYPLLVARANSQQNPANHGYNYEDGNLRTRVRGGGVISFFASFCFERFRTLKNVIFREYRSNAYVLKQTVMKNIV